MEIIRAKQADAIELADLINQAYEHEYRWKTSSRTTVEEVLKLLEQNDSYFLKGIVEKKLMACAIMEIKDQEATFGMLSVWPEYHGQGLGYKMIRFLETFAKKSGCANMGCEVASFNTQLMSYYEKMGYEWFDSKPWNNPFLKIDQVTFELYRKNLSH